MIWSLLTITKITKGKKNGVEYTKYTCENHWKSTVDYIFYWNLSTATAIGDKGIGANRIDYYISE